MIPENRTTHNNQNNHLRRDYDIDWYLEQKLVSDKDIEWHRILQFDPRKNRRTS